MVDGIYGIGVREKGRLLLKRNSDHAREMVRGPRLVKLIAAFQSAHVHFLFGGRWPGIRIERERNIVPHGVHRWVARVGMFLVSLREKNRGIDVDRMSPKSGDLLAPNADVLYPLSVCGIFGGGNDVSDGEVKVATRAKMNFHHVAVQISDCDVERFLLAIIHVHPDSVTIRAVHLGIDVNHGLRVIVAGRQIAQLKWITNGRCVQSRDLAGLKMIDVCAKNGRTVRSHGEPGLPFILGCEHKHQSSGNGPGVGGRGV